MSAAEQGDNSAILVGVISLLKKALSFSQRALRTLIAATNGQQTSLSGPTAPAVTFTLSSAPYATKVGTTVVARAFASGLASVAEDQVTLTLLVDGVAATGVMTPNENAGTGAPHFFALNLQGNVTVAVGASHVYAAQIHDSSGGTVEFASGQVQIFLTEIPS